MLYIIDIEEDNYFCNDIGEELYRVKGFNSLVFDKNGLKKLTPHRPATNTTYLGWGLAKQIMELGAPQIQAVGINDIRSPRDIFEKLSYLEAEEFVKKCKSSEIAKGQVWRDSEKDQEFIITCVMNDNVTLLEKGVGVTTVLTKSTIKNFMVNTGETIDLSSFGL